MKIVLLLVLLTLPVRAQEVLTVQQAIATALRSNPALQRQRSLAKAARAGGERIESDLYPHVRVEAVAKDGPQGAPNFSLPGLGNAGFPQSAGGDVVLLQTFDFGRTSQKFLAQKYLAISTEREGDTAAARLVLTVLRDYGQVLLFKEQLAVGRETLKAREDIARQADASYRAGLVSRVDSGLAQADLAQIQAALVDLEVQRDTALAALLTVMGQTGGASPGLEDLPAALEEWPTDLALDLEQAQQMRPEVKAARAQVDSARAKLGSVEAGYNPYLQFYAAGGYIANLNGPASSPNTYAVGMAVSVPIYTAGGVQAEIRQENANLAAALSGEQDILLTIRLEVEQARIRFAGQRERRLPLQKQLDAATDSSRLTRSRYRLGLGNIVEVQQAEQARLAAANQLAQNRAEIWLAWVELQYVTGRLGTVGEKRI
jgi:outer membrane protein TolC